MHAFTVVCQCNNSTQNTYPKGSFTRKTKYLGLKSFNYLCIGSYTMYSRVLLDRKSEAMTIILH